jgi:hypothetical protein
MTLVVQNRGDRSVKKPGTCNQTGNTAPQFPWRGTPIGRFARVFAHCIANHLGYSEDRMGKQHEFPPSERFEFFFDKMIPWFRPLYNETRKQTASQKGYTGRLEPFCGNDVENRVRYEFASPGRKGYDPHPRLYGISREHYMSTYNQKPGGRMEVWTRCSEEIFTRLLTLTPISRQEAEEWGRK